MRRWACGWALAALSVVLVLAGGCAQGAPRLASSWPKASAEATIAAPPETMKWPLTGEPLPAAPSAVRTPLAALLPLRPVSRAPAGVSAADVVYEWGSGGTDAQLLALLQSALPRAIGPLGSASRIARTVAGQYAAVTCSLAATDPTSPDVPGAVTPLRAPALFGTGPAGTPPGIYLLARKAGAAVSAASPSAQRPARLFFRASVDATEPIHSVTVPIASASVRWSYSPVARSYERFVGASRQRDSATGAPITAENVVVVWARPVGDGSSGGAGELSLVGQGQASVFRNGVREDGHWRAVADGPPRLTADDGRPILLAPGTTWFEVVPLTANITLD